MAKLSRITFTLPPQLVADLSYISEVVGVSRSALVSDILLSPVHDLRELLSRVSGASDRGGILRLRGESLDLVAQRLSELHASLPTDARSWKRGA